MSLCFATVLNREIEKEIKAQASGARSQAACGVWRRKRTERVRALSRQGRSAATRGLESHAEASRSVFLAHRVTGFPSRFALDSICRRSVVEKRRENTLRTSAFGNLGRPIFLLFVIRFVLTHITNRITQSQMQKNSVSKRAAILRCLIEGTSIAATQRITGAAKDTILNLLALAGEACLAYQDKHLRNLPCKNLQLDELWSFVGCREGAKKRAKGQHPGDVWTWTAMCADTKLVPSWRVGDRGHRTGFKFCAELSERFAGKVQITTDGYGAYKWAIGANFKDADYGQQVKVFGKSDEGRDIVIRTERKAVLGTPDMDRVSTSFVERSNLTVRMGNRRFTRLTNGFSKNLANHCHMLAITFMHYNFVRKHATIKTTPAVAAGVAATPWTMEQVVQMIDEHYEAMLSAQFEKGFADLKWTRPRTTPKTFTPVQPELPWYLDMDREAPPEGLGL